ncbi:MAG: zinc-dependent metalloprotease [Saprospiraceae bacterium]
MFQFPPSTTRWFSFLLLLILSITTVAAQTGDEDGDKDKDKKKKEKKYDDVITKETETQQGLFTIHRQPDGKLLFELPVALLDDEILVVSRISGHVKGLNFGGAGMKSRPQQVIRWQRLDNQVLLRSVSYNSVADESDPVYRSLRNNNFEPVIGNYDIMTYGPDSSSVVFDVSSLFTTDIAMIGALREDERKNFKIKGLDKSRSLITSTKAFPQNVEIRHILTYNGDSLPNNQLTNSLSLEMNQSFILLPADPMRPRYFDARVGYFSLEQTNYSADAQRADKRRFITRWRLEPVDMAAWERGELVDVKKSIIYYIDPGTPTKWAPYIKQGVDDWQKAFEAIGLRNAIMAKDAPTPEEDPDWSPEDVRYSVIRYITTDIQNAQGPHVHDPRTGEILESDILWYHNVMNLLRNWYLIQTAAVNPDAQTSRFKDDVMGELIRFVSAHEVGHTLGLPHNMGSSPAYSIDSLRSPGFVQRNGVAPSIMDYARFNYVAQPEDKGAGLIPKIGPYDYWSIAYGYKPMPKVATAEAERPILNKLIKEKASDPIYRYGRQRGNGYDPSAQTEDIGDNAVTAGSLGLANLKRILPQLQKWTAREGEDFSDLEELYGQVIGQLRRYTGHVAANVGGVREWMRSSDEDDVIYTTVPKTEQVAALNWIGDNVLTTPTWLIDQSILRRIGPEGAEEKVGALQSYALRVIFDKDRLQRVIDGTALEGDKQLGLVEMMDVLYQRVFKSNDKSVYQRNIQRMMVERLISTMQEHDDSDIGAAARLTLTKIRNQYSNFGNVNSLDAAHKQQLVGRIKAAMEPVVVAK